MKEIEIDLPREADPGRAEGLVEDWCAREGLQLTLKGSLAKHRGCTHWHWKRGRERGTLEVTAWPERRRIWMTVQSGRTGPWIEGTAARLKAYLETPATWSRGRPGDEVSESAAGGRVIPLNPNLDLNPTPLRRD